MFKLFRKKKDLSEDFREENYILFSSSDTIYELSAFSLFFSFLTKKLLKEKGFEINDSVELTAKRIALLHTEVSELVDAEKKGYEPKEKAMELADITIRLLNIPVMYNEIYAELASRNTCNDVQQYTIKYELTKIDINDDEIYNYLKMRIANDMHITISNLENALLDLKRCNTDVDKKIKKDLVIKLIFEIILQCRLYINSSSEIQGKLHEFVEEKMKKNFERPYRYNVSSNF